MHQTIETTVAEYLGDESYVTMSADDLLADNTDTPHMPAKWCLACEISVNNINAFSICQCFPPMEDKFK